VTIMLDQLIGWLKGAEHEGVSPMLATTANGHNGHNGYSGLGTWRELYPVGLQVADAGITWRIRSLERYDYGFVVEWSLLAPPLPQYRLVTALTEQMRADDELGNRYRARSTVLTTSSATTEGRTEFRPGLSAQAVNLTFWLQAVHPIEMSGLPGASLISSPLRLRLPL